MEVPFITVTCFLIKIVDKHVGIGWILVKTVIKTTAPCKERRNALNVGCGSGSGCNVYRGHLNRRRYPLKHFLHLLLHDLLDRIVLLAGLLAVLVSIQLTLLLEDLLAVLAHVFYHYMYAPRNT
jgi:hypothetical protein